MTKAEDDLKAMLEKGVSYAKGRARLCRTVGHSSGAESRSPSPAGVFWETSRTHQHTAPGPPRLQAPGPDRCKYSLTAHRVGVPACAHLTHKQPGGHTVGQGTDRAELSWKQGGKGRGGGAEEQGRRQSIRL